MKIRTQKGPFAWFSEAVVMVIAGGAAALAITALPDLARYLAIRRI
jgi:hypothetical protein